LNLLKELINCFTIQTSRLLELLAKHTSDLVVEHPDYGILAGRMATANLYKQTPNSFSHTLDCAQLFARLFVVSK
jgi:hypothetical protein